MRIMIPDISSTLESIAWATLPMPTLIARTAAYARQRAKTTGGIDYKTGAVDITYSEREPGYFVRQVVDRLALTIEEQKVFFPEVMREIARQAVLSSRRTFARRVEPGPKTKKARINAAATQIFGRPGGWFENRYNRAPVEASYSMLRHYPPDNVTLAIAETGKPYLTYALVYRIRGTPAKVYKLPGKVDNLNHLFRVMGLEKAAKPGAKLTVNWTEQSFVVSGLLIVPWNRY